MPAFEFVHGYTGSRGQKDIVRQVLHLFALQNLARCHDDDRLREVLRIPVSQMHLCDGSVADRLIGLRAQHEDELGMQLRRILWTNGAGNQFARR